MKYFTSLFILFSLLTISCTNEINQQKKDTQSILKALDEQELCWNKGDIDCFMDKYWEHDSLMFISKEKVSFGWITVKNNYKKAYTNKQLMGELTFTIIKTEPLSKDAYLVIGNWELKRDAGNYGGKFSLLWRKINNEWKIVIDHTS